MNDAWKRAWIFSELHRVADSEHDARAAIQTAIDFGIPLGEIPGGTYRISAALIMKEDQHGTTESQ